MGIKQLLGELEKLNKRNKKDFGLQGEYFNIYLRINAFIKRWRVDRTP